MAALFVKLCLLLQLLCGATVSQSTIDTLKPIARFSPVRGVESDEFGYSVAAHKMSNTAAGFMDTLKNTVIIVGAPLGRYPGGLDLPLNTSVCELYDEFYKINRTISTLTDEEIKECYLRTGLVYTCPLTGSTGCGPVLGNMDALGADGALFDRVGNIKQVNNFGTLVIQQDKNEQRMGNTVFSSGEFFVACAPFWKNINTDGSREPTVGFCVFSGRDLRNFQYTRPCVPQGSNNNKQKAFCLSGHSAAIRKGAQLDDSVLGVTTPGRYDYTGGVYYYDNLTSTDPVSMQERELELGLTRGPSVRAAVEPVKNLPADTPTSDPRNVPGVVDSMYGFATAVGDFNASNSQENFFVSSPRFMDSNLNPVGRVYVVTNFEEVANTTADGDEFGEYFGFSIATPDLNGDGYDDVVVGAPMYSKANLPELGRFFILYNNRGQFLLKNQTVEGSVALGRFGHSVTSLGDLNNDGCDDFAVSAPFDEGGKVFIYYGSKDNGLINSTVQQTITAEQMVAQVTDLDAITGFGFSLDGKVDVDGNQYRDLVVGAIGTSDNTGQAVFVLRSFPVAKVLLNITNVPSAIDRTKRNCVVNNIDTLCFDFSVCANFTGKGLQRIEPEFKLQENVIGQQRLFFDPSNEGSSILTGVFNFSNTGPVDEFCREFTVYVRNDLTSSQTLNPISFAFQLLPFERSQTPVDTNFQPDDLVTLPVIQALPIGASVEFIVDCGPDEVCVSDLELLHNSVSYRDNDLNALEDQLTLVAGNVRQVVIDLSYRNLEEPAFGLFLNFSLPSVFFNPTISPREPSIECRGTSNSNNNMVNYMCSGRGFPDPLEMSQGLMNIQLILQVSSTGIRGDEGSFNISIQLGINNVAKNIENGTSLNNNDVVVNIPVSAKSRVAVQIPIQPRSYFGNIQALQISSAFRNFTVVYNFINSGPSTIFSATLTMLLPFRIPDQQNQYYLYPYSIHTTPQGAVNCEANGVIDPENLQESLNTRRRRHVEDHVVISKQAIINDIPTSLNCSSNPGNCQMLTCHLTNITRSTASVSLTVIVDERTYFNMHQTFSLVTTLGAAIHNNFIDITGPNTTSGAIQISRITPLPTLPVYAIVLIVLAVVVPCLFIIVGVIICVAWGCFHYRYHKRKSEDDAVEAYDANPFNTGELKLTDVKAASSS